MKALTSITTLAAATLAVSSLAASAATLDDVKSKGEFNCGVSQGLPGFSSQDTAGNWVGLDVDVCRAVSAAIFGSPDKVKYVSLSGATRFTALSSGEADILSRNTTWTMSRDTNLGLTFAGINYYDGQGFIVHKKLGVKSVSELSGASVCTQSGTTTELNVADYFRAHNMTYELVAFENADEVVQAYDAGRCDAFTTDRSGLAAERLKFANPDDHVVLPEVISKEPLGPVVRRGDEQWRDIVRWTLNALIIAEELGVTSANVDEMMNSENPEIKRLLGTEGDFGAMIGLEKGWAAQAIKAVGNYGESFERNVGVNTPLKLERGTNALWSQGGILYAPPIR